MLPQREVVGSVLRVLVLKGQLRRVQPGRSDLRLRQLPAVPGGVREPRRPVRQHAGHRLRPQVGVYRRGNVGFEKKGKYWKKESRG